MEIRVVKIEKPAEMNFILGHSHFIKTVEDIHEAIVNINPGIKFGLAFCEASQKALVRFSGNDEDLIKLAQKNAKNLACGHSFILFLGNAFPVKTDVSVSEEVEAMVGQIITACGKIDILVNNVGISPKKDFKKST